MIIESAVHQFQTSMGDVNDPVDVYCWAYQKHFGRRLVRIRQGQGPSRATVFKAFANCIEHGIDFEEWVTAQIVTLRPSLQHRGVPFYPNMLLGKHAMERYKDYQRKGESRFHRSKADAWDSTGVFVKLWDRMTVEETKVGRYFVATAVAGDRVTWMNAVAYVGPADEWQAVVLREKSPVRTRPMLLDLLKKHGDGMLAAASAIVRLRAMVNVVTEYHDELPDRLSSPGRFQWDALADLLAHIYGNRTAPVYDLSGVPGFTWRPGCPIT
jgi:hypothetical protein